MNIDILSVLVRQWELTVEVLVGSQCGQLCILYLAPPIPGGSCGVQVDSTWNVLN